jgi:hypothetical protein
MHLTHGQSNHVDMAGVAHVQLVLTLRSLGGLSCISRDSDVAR